MNKQMELSNREVVCLHCKMHTCLSNPTNLRRFSDGFIAARPKIELVRCTTCGKEAPYLAEEIMVTAPIPTMGLHAA
jgi:hypothetical protein